MASQSDVVSVMMWKTEHEPRNLNMTYDRNGNSAAFVALTDRPIDTNELLKHAGSHRAGAILLFLGTTRETTGGRHTSSLDYECYPEMALKKLHELAAKARLRWDLVECAIVHRVGHLELGETSVAVVVSAPHRREAFQAGEWLVDELKQVVPIWKQENWADGTSQWVHPGLETRPQQSTKKALR